MPAPPGVPAAQPAAEPAADPKWVKTPFRNLVRNAPSGTYFARIRIQGRLIVRSLQTQVLTVAKLRLTDLEKAERSASERTADATRGKMLVSEAAKLLQARIEGDASLKPRSRVYYQQRLTALFKSWPELKARDIRSITQSDCLAWAARFSTATCSTAFNNTVGVLRRLFDIAIELGARYENPAGTIKKVGVRPKELHLPSTDQFNRFLTAIELAGGRSSKKCADLVRFLAFGGFRLGEAANITWADCNFDKNEIVVRGDAVTGTKSSTTRKVPMIEQMVQLLTKLKLSVTDLASDAAVVGVKECQKAMDRAAEEVGMVRITHHDLRHLFATRCIEAGVDIPTVSRWLGHKDGGALAMKVYGHLRDEHSTAMAQKVSFAVAPAQEPAAPAPQPAKGRKPKA